MKSRIVDLDTWSSSSLVQKAIRRGMRDEAHLAADALVRWRGNRIWRRLLLIAVEDVGIADIELIVELAQTVLEQPASNRTVDLKLVYAWVDRLATAQKDRSTDYLICSANSHPDWENDRKLLLN